MTITYCMRDEGLKAGLRDLCGVLPVDAGLDIVEVGVYVGESTLVLLESGKFKRYVAVDQFVDDYDHAQTDIPPVKYKMSDVEASFRENVISKYPFVELLKEDSAAAAKHLTGQQFDVVYIDADHRYEFVKRDIADYIKLIRPGGIIAGHDYNDAWGVKRAVDEVLDGPTMVFSDSSWLKKLP